MLGFLLSNAHRSTNIEANLRLFKDQAERLPISTDCLWVVITNVVGLAAKKVREGENFEGEFYRGSISVTTETVFLQRKIQIVITISLSLRLAITSIEFY